MLKASRLFCFAIITTSLPVAGDNAHLMNEQAKHLIDINSEALKQLSSIPDNTHVSMQADVVQRNGQTQIRIGNILFSTPSDSPPGQEAVKEKQTASQTSSDSTVRFGPVIAPYSTIPTQSSISKTSGTPDKLTSTPIDSKSESDNHTVEEIVLAHPKAKVRPLSKTEIEQLDWSTSSKPSGAAVISWED